MTDQATEQTKAFDASRLKVSDAVSKSVTGTVPEAVLERCARKIQITRTEEYVEKHGAKQSLTLIGFSDTQKAYLLDLALTAQANERAAIMDIFDAILADAFEREEISVGGAAALKARLRGSLAYWRGPSRWTDSTIADDVRAYRARVALADGGDGARVEWSEWRS